MLLLQHVTDTWHSINENASHSFYYYTKSSKPGVCFYTHDTLQFGPAASQVLSSGMAAATVDREGGVGLRL